MKLIALAVALAGCATTVGPTHRVVLSPSPPRGEWTVMRDTLLGCAIQQGLVGPIEARISFDADGMTSSVGSGYGDPFARCVGVGLGHTHFRTEAGGTLLVAFTAPSPQPIMSCETLPTPCETQGAAN